MHFRSHAVEEGGELHADHTAADDHQRSRQFFGQQRLTACPILRFRQSGNGGYDSFRTGADKQVGGFINSFARGDSDRSVSCPPFDFGFAAHHFHAVLLHLHADAGCQFLYDFIFTSDDLREIESRILRTYRIFGGVFDRIKHFRRIKQSLCRHASFIQAHTA